MKKYEILIETLVVVIALIVLVIVVAIPQIKEELGSSDYLLNKKDVVKLININIDNNLYGLELSKDNKVVNIIFYNETSLVLYNKNIEKKDLSFAITKSLELYKNKISNNKVIVTKYDDDTSSYEKYFNGYSYQEKVSTYKKLNNEYKLNSNSTDEILNALNIKSKDYVISVKNIDITDYTDYVYKKLLVYQTTNKITNETKNNHSLDITTIQVKDLNDYPTSNSYYYIKDSKVYAYIELTVNNLDIGYCYRGSYNNYIKGKCNDEK